jgi:hypothetical protein
MEHRWGKRISMQTAVGLEGNTFERATGFIANLSISGAWIQAAVAPPSFTIIRVLIGRRPVPAWVVRHEPGGFGVEWRELAPAQVKQLLRARQYCDVADAGATANVAALTGADNSSPADQPAAADAGVGMDVLAEVARRVA